MPAVPALDAAARRSLAFLVAGALLPLAGCTSSGDSPSSGGGGSVTSIDVPHFGRDQVAEGGTVRWAVDEVPHTLNAFQPDADAATDRVAGATLPALFTLDAAARPQRNPDYLDSADITSHNPQTVVYKLNPKARWSTGRAIGLADFKAQWKALSGKHHSYAAARNAGYDRIRKVTKGSAAHEVKVVFRKPLADWRSLFTPLYPKPVMAHADDFNHGARTSLPSSGGPFRVQKIHDGDGSVSLVRNRHWWGDRAKLKRIRLTAVPREDRKEALTHSDLDLAEVDASVVRRVVAAHKEGKQSGEGDAKSDKKGHGEHAKQQKRKKAEEKDGAGHPDKAQGAEGSAQRAVARSPQRVAENRKLSHFAVRQAFDPAYTQLALNGASGPLADERVRRAVARAINRQALAKQALRGTGLPAKPLGSHLRMVDQDGYTDNSDALGDQDVESAQSLLAEAGWENGTRPNSGNTDAKKSDDRKAHGKKDHGKDKDGKGSSHNRAGTALRDGAAARPGSAAEVARLGGRPLNLAPSTTAQRASLLTQVARVHLRKAAKTDSVRKLHEARTDLKKAERAQAHAHALRLLSSGGAKIVRMKEGKPLALRFVLPVGPGSESLRATGGRIAKELTRIGVRTKIKEVASDSYFKDYIASGNYDLALYSWPGTAYPSTDARPIFAKPEAAADGSLLVEQNYTRVGTNQIDQLFDQASTELDDANRADLIRRADARIWAAAGSVPLYQRPQLVVAREKIANAGAFGFQTPRYQDIGYER